ncbi:hypothetical protein J6590_074396 [Homalodisca vitripennis]|nr:hypothetical protein J6590_074396 [Homalodisca vitripennis]
MHVIPPGITTYDSLCSSPYLGTRNVLSMHVIQPGITTHDSLCSHPCLGRHWTFTLYGRYTTRDHNSRQSLLSPPAWVGTGNLLSMHVTPPEITAPDSLCPPPCLAPDSLCPPPCLGRHWTFTLYARYTTRDHSSRQSLPFPVPG